jgi:hypothetical protein
MKEIRKCPITTVHLEMNDIEDFILGININRVRKGEKLSPQEIDIFCSLCHKNRENLANDIMDYYKANCFEDGILKERARFNFLKGKKYKEIILSESEDNDYKNLCLKEVQNIIKMIHNAIRKSGPPNVKRAINENFEQIQKLVKQCLDFKSEVILIRTKSIWWDRERMLHIYSAHVEETFLSYYNKPGKKEQTLFLHSLSDIKKLIQQVLESIDDEIQNHFINFPNSSYLIKSAKILEFDGNKYAVRINPDGKLMNFHREVRKYK